MKILLLVDVQKEFAKDEKGKQLYADICKYVAEYGHVDYDLVIATLYKNGNSNNMHNMVKWDEMRDIQEVDYAADYALIHSGYCPRTLSMITPDDEVTVIGYDTDACVMSTLFRLFDMDVPFRVIENGIWSSGGISMHEAGLKVINRQFGTALYHEPKLGK